MKVLELFSGYGTASFAKNLIKGLCDECIKGGECGFNFDIMQEDLRDWIFKEDLEGNRYRERIWDKIKEFGVEKWFKAKGYPTEKDSVWKNRYCGTLTTLGRQIIDIKWRTIEDEGYLLWENYLPESIWNDKELSLSYKVGTKEYHDRIKEEEAHDKKYSKKGMVCQMAKR